MARNRAIRYPATFGRSVTLTSPSWLVNENVATCNNAIAAALRVRKGLKVLPGIRERGAKRERKVTRVTKAIPAKATRATLDRKVKTAILVRQAVSSK